MGGGAGRQVERVSMQRYILLRLVDTALAIPVIMPALVLAAAVGASFTSVVVVLVFILCARYAWLVRAETLSIKSRGFISRSRVAGASNFRIISRHVFPNVVNTIVVLATLEVEQVILLEATLSFLGVGIPRPNPAWGLMVADPRDLLVSAWWWPSSPAWPSCSQCCP
jgi:peptide/nickel transport system permease protein